MFPISLKNLSDKERHDYILNTFVLNKQQNSQKVTRERHDIDVIKENHRFLWDDDNPPIDSWETRLAKRYYDKLFKEYCITDLTRYKENKIALRWRTEAEVITGKGQFQCGTRKCEEKSGLRSWEVNFAYVEHGLRKNALVKVRLCPVHSAQLNYRSQKREIKRLKRAERQEKKQKNTKRKSKSKERSSRGETNTNDDSNTEELDRKEASGSAEESLPMIQEQTNVADIPDTDVWSKKQDIELETSSRETDFERYLEDLLL